MNQQRQGTGREMEKALPTSTTLLRKKKKKTQSAKGYSPDLCVSELLLLLDRRCFLVHVYICACASFQGRLLLLSNETNTFSDCDQTAHPCVAPSLSPLLCFSFTSLVCVYASVHCTRSAYTNTKNTLSLVVSE